MRQPTLQQLRTRLLAALAGMSDYRGFDQHEGWRHGVAHGADLAPLPYARG